MENKSTDSKIDYCSTVYTDTWNNIFDSITKLIAIERELGGKSVKALQELHKLAKDAKEINSKRLEW